MAVRIVMGGGQSVAGAGDVARHRARISRGRGGGRSSGRSSAPSAPTVSVNGNTVKINGQGFSVPLENQAAFIKQKTGGVGASAQQEIKRAELRASIAKKAAADRLAAAEAQRQRIANIKRQIKLQGAQEQTKILRNQLNQRIQETTTNLKRIQNGIPTDITIHERTNLDTGETTSRIFEKRRAGQRKTLTGGVSVVHGEVTAITPSSKTGRVNVRLRDGRIIDINATGRVVLGKSITGTKNLYFYNGEWVEKFPAGSKPNKFLSRFGVDTAKLTAVALRTRARLITRRDKLVGETQNLSAGQRKTLAEVESIVRANPNLSETQIKKKIKAQMSKDSIDTLLRGLSNMTNILFIKAATTLIDIGVATPVMLTALRKAPLATISALPAAVIEGLKQDWKTAKSGDGIKIAELAAEYYTLGKVFKVAGLAGRKTLRGTRKLLPGYITEVNGRFVIRKAPSQVFNVRGTPRLLKTRVQKPSFKRPFSSVADFVKGRKPGQFKKFTKDPGLILKSQTVASGGRPLSAQARLAGRQVTAVNAAADQITSWLRRKRLVRKPIPGEADFPATIKRILKDFDTGKTLSNKEFAKVNLYLQRNVAPNITLLERSLYLDPASGLRLNRLRIQAERSARLSDILRGNIKFRSAKPQVLIFENAKVAKFPKSLAKIKNKLLKDKPLTVAETNKLIRWQTQTGSGKFKPVGSTIYAGGKELEVTLAPGSLIKRLRKVGITHVQGKKVTFVTAEVFKPSKVLAKQIKLANLGKLTKLQLGKLEKLLSKKLGRKIKVETPDLKKAARRAVRRADANVPVLRLRAGGIHVVLFRNLVRRVKSKRPTPRKTKVRPKARAKPRARPKARPRARPKAKPRPKPRPKPRGRAKARPKPRPKARPKPRGRPTGRGRPTPTSTKPKPIPRLDSKFKRKTLRKAVPVYYVVMKRKGKMVKLSPQPFRLSAARDFLAYRIDTGLSRQAYLFPIGKQKKVISPPRNIQGYYSRNKNKLRPYKIRVGKKKRLLNGYIEKSRYSLDKPGEKKALARSRRKVVRRPVKKVVKRRPVRRKPVRRVKRRLTPTQRRRMLANLKKARAARKRKR